MWAIVLIVFSRPHDSIEQYIYICGYTYSCLAVCIIFETLDMTREELNLYRFLPQWLDTIIAAAVHIYINSQPPIHPFTQFGFGVRSLLLCLSKSQSTLSRIYTKKKHHTRGSQIKDTRSWSTRMVQKPTLITEPYIWPASPIYSHLIACPAFQ